MSENAEEKSGLGVDQERSTTRTTDPHPAIERAIDAGRARSTLGTNCTCGGGALPTHFHATDCPGQDLRRIKYLYPAFRYLVQHGELPPDFLPPEGSND